MHHVDEEQPRPADFAVIEVPVLLVSALDSPPEQRAMNDAMADALPNVRPAKVEERAHHRPRGPGGLAFGEEILR